MFKTIFFILVWIGKVLGDLSLLNTSYHNLLDKVYEGYNVNAFPVKNPNDTLIIHLDFSLIQLLIVDDTEETITWSGFMNMYWVDQGISWNPSDYKGITFINIPVTTVWTPDLYFTNAASSSSWNMWGASGLLLTVDNYGSVSVNPPSIITTKCSTDITNFPFDEKLCKILYGSWQYASNQINLTCDDIYLDQYVPNGEWDLLKAIPKVKLYEVLGNAGAYSLLEVDLYFRRRTMFYTFNFIIPNLFLSVLTVFSFILPPERGEKVGILISNLIGIVFVAQYISTIVPPSSRGFPKISLYLLTVIILNTLSLIANALVLNLFGKDVTLQKAMPKWAEKFFFSLGWLLRFKPFEFNESKKNQVEPLFEMIKTESNVREISKTNIKIEKDQHNENDFARKDQLLNVLLKIDKRIEKILEKYEENEINDEKKLKWRYAALVLDTLFLYITIIAVIITFTAIIMSNPNLYKL